MGLGHTLSEALRFADGEICNATLAGYRVPSTVDVPPDLATGHVANGDGPGPFGARGVGEAAIVPVGAAVGNALRAATGVDPHELPLTPERVWRLLQEAGLGPPAAPPPRARRRSGSRRRGG
jgi:CO/xanthine dehydrogenase Mo-binding subunit